LPALAALGGDEGALVLVPLAAFVGALGTAALVRAVASAAGRVTPTLCS
jgi:hypothetical protein